MSTGLLSIIHHAASLYHSISHVTHGLRDAHDLMASSVFNRAVETVEHLRLKLPESLSNPRVAVVCGSGLGGLAETVNRGVERQEFAYKDVPNFPLLTVPGHEGKLIFSTMGSRNVPVVLLVGRAHFYEGHEMETVTFATRVCRLLGVQTMLLTNAAGGLNPTYNVGDIICLTDHLNLAGLSGFHPLRGPNADDFGTRFPAMSDAYDISLRQLALRSWQNLQEQQQQQEADPTSTSTSATTQVAPPRRRMHTGIYAFVAGPSYETRAECRMLRQLGADVVGMSTVPEIIVARHCGMRVLAFSLVTNKAVLEPAVGADDPELEGLSAEELEGVLGRGRADHGEVLEAGRAAAVEMQGLVLRVVSEL